MGMSGIPAPPALLARVLRVIWPLVAAGVTVVALPVLCVGALLSLVDRRARLFRATGLLLVLVWLDLQLLLGCWRLWLADPRGTSDTWIEDHEVLMLNVLDTAIRLGRK